MRVDEKYYLEANDPDKIDYPRYMLSKYACGGQLVPCFKCQMEFPLQDVEIHETFLDATDRRLVDYSCPKCGDRTIDMLNLYNLAKADKKKLQLEKESLEA